MISASVRSAVSSVKTPGVLVTTIRRARAAAMSMWSVPAPKLAIMPSRSPACAIIAVSMVSVTVGTSTSQSRIAASSWVRVIGVSSRLKTASNNSAMRASTAGSSLRVMMTRGRGGIGRWVSMIPRGYAVHRGAVKKP